MRWKVQVGGLYTVKKSKVSQVNLREAVCIVTVTTVKSTLTVVLSLWAGVTAAAAAVVVVVVGGGGVELVAGVVVVVSKSVVLGDANSK